MHFLVILITSTLFFYTKGQQHLTMGMSYDIIPNKKTKCSNEFGEGLSFFFEQVGGYEETAEVEQVSRILKLDLSVFQDIDYNYENKSDVEKHWHTIDAIYSLVDTFIHKIVANPEYYKQVHHNHNREKQLDDEQRLWQLKDSSERDRQLELLRQQPFYYYPPDYRYLSEGRLLKGLQTLKMTLDCYKKSGVTKIRFEYN